MSLAEQMSIRFSEAGHTVEIDGPMNDGRWWAAIYSPDGEIQSLDEPDFDHVRRNLDVWFDKNVPAGEPGRFGGFRLERWMHEEGSVRTTAYRTRGELLEVFDDGCVPTLEHLVEHSECAGDLVLRVWNGAGVLLCDRRDTARERLSRMTAPAFGF